MLIRDHPWLRFNLPVAVKKRIEDSDEPFTEINIRHSRTETFSTDNVAGSWRGRRATGSGVHGSSVIRSVEPDRAQTDGGDQF